MNKFFLVLSFLLLHSCVSSNPAPIEYLTNSGTNKHESVKVKTIAHPHQNIEKESDEEYYSLPQKEIRHEDKIDNSIIKEQNQNIEKEKEIIHEKIKDDQTLEEQVEEELKNNKEEFSENESENQNHVNDHYTSNIFEIAPVNGKIIKKFNKTNLANKFEAVIFSTPKGSIIKSVSEGTVIYSGFDPKFGNIVIVSYKDFQIAYGYIKEIIVKKGSSVGVGDIIGYVGDIINSQNSGLYFAVRDKNIAIDPETVIPKTE